MRRAVHSDVDLTTDDLKEIIVGYKALVKEEMGREFPQEPKDQLMEADNGCIQILEQRQSHPLQKAQ